MVISQARISMSVTSILCRLLSNTSVSVAAIVGATATLDYIYW